MHDAGFLEHLADGNEALFQVEALGMHLRVEHGAPKAALARMFEEELQHAPSDTRAAAFGQHGHPPDLDVIAMHEHPAASHRTLGTVRICDFERERMDGVRVVGVEFDFLGYVLFFDKDAAAERPCLLHPRAIVADLDNADRRRSFHRISTSARPSHRQTAPRAGELNPVESR
jgi:hypothetical protein